MLREETSKPQYEVRPTLFIHAANDMEAEARLSYVEAALTALLNSDDHSALNMAQWAYTDVRLNPGCLVESGWPDGEDRIVR